MRDLAANRLLKEGTLKLGAGGDALRPRGSVDCARGGCEFSGCGLPAGGRVDMYTIDCLFLGLVITGLWVASRGGAVELARLLLRSAGELGASRGPAGPA